MAIVEVKVPQLSESVAEATLLQWKKKPGEAVAMDEILIEIETDKVVLEVPAPAAGVLAEMWWPMAAPWSATRSSPASTPKARPGARSRKAVAPAAAAACRCPAAPPPLGGSKAGVAMPAAAKLMADNNLAPAGGRHRQGRPRDQG
jgi:2-oxoglutarate dehydrogenase E2 component (dihydrolipoamide succinyltransferase)